MTERCPKDKALFGLLSSIKAERLGERDEADLGLFGAGNQISQNSIFHSSYLASVVATNLDNCRCPFALDPANAETKKRHFNSMPDPNPKANHIVVIG